MLTARFSVDVKLSHLICFTSYFLPVNVTYRFWNLPVTFEKYMYSMSNWVLIYSLDRANSSHGMVEFLQSCLLSFIICNWNDTDILTLGQSLESNLLEPLTVSAGLMRPVEYCPSNDTASGPLRAWSCLVIESEYCNISLPSIN